MNTVPPYLDERSPADAQMAQACNGLLKLFASTTLQSFADTNDEQCDGFNAMEQQCLLTEASLAQDNIKTSYIRRIGQL